MPNDSFAGDGVNIAARLESLTDPGGICISGAAYEQVKKRLDVGSECMGDKSVKNIAEPVPEYKVLLDASKAVDTKEKSQRARPGRWRISYLIAPAIIVTTVASVGIWYFHLPAVALPNKGSLAETPAFKLSD